MPRPSKYIWLGDCLIGFTAYYLTTLPVVVGVLFGTQFLRRDDIPSRPPPDLISACLHFDAGHYLQIMRGGYTYDPDQRSLVAFFPAYPLTSLMVSRATGLPIDGAALLTANIALVGAFVLLARYARVRWPGALLHQRWLVLAIFGLWPTGLFFRMGYPESLFVCGMLGVLYGMARGWPITVLALLAGFVTATRPVGLAVSAALFWHVLAQPGFSPRAKIGRVFLLAPLACWGLLAYMGYQWWAFDTPWSFAQTQKHWSMRAPADYTWGTKLWCLTVFEPIWGVYVPGYSRYWASGGDGNFALFSMIFWNPILFMVAILLLVLGSWKGWLNGSELVCGGFLLAIPYLTRSYEMSMASHGRFAAIIVVNYLVVARTFSPASRFLISGVCAALVLSIFIFTTLYVWNYPVF